MSNFDPGICARTQQDINEIMDALSPRAESEIAATFNGVCTPEIAREMDQHVQDMMETLSGDRAVEDLPPAPPAADPGALAF
jgi:hypothetical protein